MYEKNYENIVQPFVINSSSFLLLAAGLLLIHTRHWWKLTCSTIDVSRPISPIFNTRRAERSKEREKMRKNAPMPELGVSFKEMAASRDLQRVLENSYWDVEPSSSGRGGVPFRRPNR